MHSSTQTTQILLNIFSQMCNTKEENNLLCFTKRIKKDEKITIILYTIDLRKKNNIKILESCFSNFLTEKENNKLVKKRRTLLKYNKKILNFETYNYCEEVEKLIKQLYKYVVEKCMNELVQYNEFLLDDSFHFLSY